MPEAQFAEGIFQIKSPICGVNFSNNISITQVRVNRGKLTWLDLWNLLTINLPPVHDLIISPM